MIFVFAAAGAMERSSSISKSECPSTYFPTGKPRPSKSGCGPIPVWRSSAGIAEARLRDLGKAGSAQSEAGRRSLALTQKSLGDDAELLSRAAQSLLKSLIQNSAAEVPPEAKPPELAPWHSGMTKRQEEKSQRLHQQRVELYHQIQDLAAKKIDVATIARKLGVSRQTVYTYLQMRQPPGRTRIHQGGKRLIDPYKEYLVGRWNEGCRSAQQMYREIKEQGYTGSSTAVGRFVAPLRAHKGKARSFKSVEPELATMVNPEEVKQKRPPTALQIAHWMTFKEEQRLEWQQSYLIQLCEQDPQIAQTYELIQAFTSMLRERAGERLDEWLERVENQGVVELQSFAEATQEGL